MWECVWFETQPCRCLRRGAEQRPAPVLRARLLPPALKLEVHGAQLPVAATALRSGSPRAATSRGNRSIVAFFASAIENSSSPVPLPLAAHLACDLRLTTWRMALWLAMPGLLLLVLARLLLIAAVAPRTASDVLPPAAAHCAFFSRLKIDYHDVTVATVGGMHQNSMKCFLVIRFMVRARAWARAVDWGWW